VPGNVKYIGIEKENTGLFKSINSSITVQCINATEITEEYEK